MTGFKGIKYRTADGRDDYTFDFVRQASGDWRIDIISQPSYKGRGTSMHDTHRLGSQGQWYVCWTDPIRSLRDAKSIAALWADATQVYIRTGRFTVPAARTDIHDVSTMANFTETSNGSVEQHGSTFRERIARFLR